jgi:two-component system, OmpR family, alkaline phosphatase synthesis response regulator PhoP
MAVKILLAENEIRSQVFICEILQRHGYEVQVANNGDELLEKAQDSPDLIILEVFFPEQGGWELARALKREKRTAFIPIIFMTSKDSDIDEIIGFELGGADYIKKPIHEGIFLARLRSILRQHEDMVINGKIPSDVYHIEDLEIDTGNYTVKVRELEIHFTKKEIELLSFLVKHRGRVLPRSVLLKSLWGEEARVNERTLDVHIRKIREKLGTYQHYITTVKKVGYKFRSQ